MLINAVCRECGLTKKAVEYYIEQGLVAPSVQENGYRDFSDADLARLKKISVLRGLGLSVADIQGVLADLNPSLNDILHQKDLEISILQEKQELMQELARTQDWDTVQGKLVQLQKKQSVLERMRTAFPGYYGNYICQHFAPYLGEPVRTARQQEAFDTIIAFLDGIRFEIPSDLRTLLIMRITFWKICLSVCATQSAILSGILTRTAKPSRRTWHTNRPRSIGRQKYIVWRRR